MVKTTLYYDLDDKVLWVVEGDRKYPIYTYANLNVENTRLDQGLYLLVKDGDSGNWVDVLGTDGTKVSLKGEPGKPGKDGNDGSSYDIYDVILSNATDLVYVDENYYINPNQDRVYSNISIYKNGALINTDDWNITLEEGPYLNRSLVYIDGDRIVANFENAAGIQLKSPQLVYVVTCKLTDDENVSISKQFTLKRIQGSVDYDLLASRQVIRLKANGDVASNSKNITVKIKARTIGLKSEVKYLTPGELPQSYSVYYQWTNKNRVKINDDGEIDVDNISDNDALSIILTYNDDIVDELTVSCIKDGPKGADGASGYYLNIENDYDQIYKKDGKLIPEQTYKTNFYLYQGSTRLTLDDTHTTISVDKITSEWSIVSCGYGENGEGVIEIAFTDIDVYKFESSWKSLKYTLNVHHLTEDNQVIDISHDIRIAIIDSTVDYDFVLDTTSIRKDGYENLIAPLDIGFSIKKKDLISSTATVESLTTFQDLEDNGLLVWVSVNDGTPEQLEGDGESLLNISQETQRGVTHYLTLKLYKKDDLDVAIDSERIIVVQDGTEAKILTVSIPNDTELLYVNSEGKLISTFWHFLKGYELYEGSTQCSGATWTLEQVLGTYKTAIEVGDNENTGLFEIAIGFLDNSTKIEDRQLVFKLTGTLEDGRSAFAFIKFIVLKGTVDYDLHTNHETIHRDADGNCMTKLISVWVSAKGLVNSGDTTNHDKYDWTKTHIVLYKISNDDSPNWTKVSCKSDAKYGEISLDPDAFGTLQAPTLTIQLLEKRTVPETETETEILIDETILNVYSDGTPGTPGTPGAPGYTCNLTNDTELAYFDPDGNLRAPVTIKTTRQVISGSGLLTYGTDFTVTSYYMWSNGKTTEITGADDTEPSSGTSFSLRFDPDLYLKANMPVGILFEFYLVKGNVLIGQKELKILHLQGNWDYDLYLPATISVDATGLAKEDLVVRIKKSDTSDPSNFLISEKLPNNITILPTINGVGLAFTTTRPNQTHTISRDFLNANRGESLVVLLRRPGDVSDPTLLIDQEIIPFVKDGDKGDKGDKGDDAVNIVVTASQPYIWLNGKTPLKPKKGYQFALFDISKTVGNTKTKISKCTVDAIDDVFTCIPERHVTLEPDGSIRIKVWATPDKEYETKLYPLKATIDGVSIECQILTVQGTHMYDLICAPSYIKYNPTYGKFENVKISVQETCSGGGYCESKPYSLSANSDLKIVVEDGSSTDTTLYITYKTDGTAVLSPHNVHSTTIKILDSDSDIKDFQILSVVLDGMGMVTEFPDQPGLGDSVIWGGKSGLNNGCFQGYVIHGESYIYSQLTTTKNMGVVPASMLAWAPLRVMIILPDKLNSGYSILDDKLPPSLAFDSNNNLIQFWRTGQKEMSWDVCIGMNNEHLLGLLQKIIEFARSCYTFDAKTYEVTYPNKYKLQKYKYCHPIASTVGRLYNALSTSKDADCVLYEAIKSIVAQDSGCNIGRSIVSEINRYHTDGLDDKPVYIIPYQPVLEGATGMWGEIFSLNEDETGWVSARSLLSNGINTNLLGLVSTATVGN